MQKLYQTRYRSSLFYNQHQVQSDHLVHTAKEHLHVQLLAVRIALKVQEVHMIGSLVSVCDMACKHNCVLVQLI